VKLLTGELDPDGGRVEKGLHSKIGHYEQTIPDYSGDKRIIDIVRDTAEHITLAEGKKITATQLLERFLFSKLQQQQKFVSLSGGEKKRLHLLVTLIKQPNILILDEPTNDLDLSTMTILEDFLQHYPGCLIIISHDRYFVDKLVDHIFVFEGNGVIKDIWGNYTQAREKMRK
jgi:ATP-binding cassette subfamily F protein uup